MGINPVRDRSGAVARIALLGALTRGPAHGYEVKAALERWDMHWWANVQPGSIYAGLQKLDEAGLVRVVENSRNGNRPMRRVYEITDEGRAALHDMLREAWVDFTRFSRPVDLAVSFFDQLDRAEIVELLTQRLQSLAAIEHIFLPEQMRTLTNPAQRAVAQDLRDHELRLIRAELEWTQQLLKRIRSKTYPPSYAEKE